MPDGVTGVAAGAETANAKAAVIRTVFIFMLFILYFISNSKMLANVRHHHFSFPYFSMHHSCHEFNTFCHTT